MRLNPIIVAKNCEHSNNRQVSFWKVQIDCLLRSMHEHEEQKLMDKWLWKKHAARHHWFHRSAWRIIYRRNAWVFLRSRWKANIKWSLFVISRGKSLSPKMQPMASCQWFCLSLSARVQQKNLRFTCQSFSSVRSILNHPPIFLSSLSLLTSTNKGLGILLYDCHSLALSAS